MIEIVIEPVDPSLVNVYVDDRLVASRVEIVPGDLVRISVPGVYE